MPLGLRVGVQGEGQEMGLKPRTGTGQWQGGGGLGQSCWGEDVGQRGGGAESAPAGPAPTGRIQGEGGKEATNSDNVLSQMLESLRLAQGGG